MTAFHPSSSGDTMRTSLPPSSRLAEPQKDLEEDDSLKPPGSWHPRLLEPLPPNHGHSVNVLRSWAKRTGYKSNVSGETVISIENSAEFTAAECDNSTVRLVHNDYGQHGGNSSSNSKNPFLQAMPIKPPIEDRKAEAIVPSSAIQDRKVHAVNPSPDSTVSQKTLNGFRENMLAHTTSDQKTKDSSEIIPVPIPEGFDNTLPDDKGPDAMKFDINSRPSLGPAILYGMQHYLSSIGSIVIVPLVLVPAMGGSDVDTADVVSTVLMVTGLATIIHTSCGSRLPLVQGPSFVYLAPALTTINSTKFLSIGSDRFKHTMRELQGSVIVASIVQAFLGCTGLMSVLQRILNPVIVTPTVAAVGLAFFSYGFPVAGLCMEIGLPQVLIILIFALYMRRISVSGQRIFQVYAVPLGLTVVWTYAFILTAAGTYTYKGCNASVPISNIVSDSCRMHVSTMLHCRTDISSALRDAAWFRFPYPFQWGIPTFHWETAAVMIVASLIATTDSVGSYHASSLLVASGPPTPGIVSRGIGIEGVTSLLAGLWGIGTGATTLTENVHAIAVAKMGSRRVVELGACLLMAMSIVGKIGAFIASIPQVIVAALLCVMCMMITAFGLSNLRYSETGSSRNVIIVGASLFLSLTIPAYFQHYGAGPATVASYFQPYTVAAHGPVHTGMMGLDYFLNTTLSMNMVIAFIVAFVLDNTVPGSKQERGTYLWSKPLTVDSDQAFLQDYSLPPKVAKLSGLARWVGL